MESSVVYGKVVSSGDVNKKTKCNHSYDLGLTLTWCFAGSYTNNKIK